MINFPLPVVLNGTRNYVQGSQIASHAIQHMREYDARHLLSISFHKITDRLVNLSDTPDIEKEKNLGEVTVQTGDGQKKRVYLVAQSKIAPRKAHPKRVRYETLRRQAPLDAVFAVDNVVLLEDFFDALVQSVKQLHEDLANDVEDVWFTGLRGTSFPLQPDALAASGTLTVDYKRILQSGDRWQTLMGFSFSNKANENVLAGGLTFAFKSRTKPNVD